MTKSITILICILLSTNLYSNNKDSVLIDSHFLFEDGIYIDFNSVKTLNPINVSSIVTDIPINDIEFFKKLTSNEKISFYDNSGLKQIISTKNIWGYSSKGILHKKTEEGFYIIPITGAISQYVAEIKVIREMVSDSYMTNYYNGMGSASYETKETHMFMISLETGIVYDYSYKNLEILLSADEKLFLEYTSLKKRKRKQQIFLFIQKYNKKHPLYFEKK